MAVLSTIANVATPGLPVGSIQAFAGANAPAGWLLCDGSAVGRAEYPDLFSTLGTAYGAGNTTTTFNIPDLRGRVPAGKDNMGGTAAGRLTSAVSGVSGTALGSSGGSQNIPDHSHQSYIRVLEFYDDMIVGQSGQSQIGGYNSRTGAWTTWQHPVTTVTASANNHTGRSTQATWVSQTNMVSDGPSYQQTPQNVQPTLVVNYIIKAVADIARGGWYTQSSPPVVTQLPTNPAIGEEVYLYTQYGYVYQRYNGSSWDILSDNRKVYASVILSTGFVNSTTLLNFNNTLTNVGNAYSTANGRFTCPITGKYRATFYGMTENGVGYGLVDLYKNGSLVSLTRGYQYGTSSGHHHFTSDVIISANATDYLQWRYEGTIRLYSDGLGYTGATFQFMGE